jgi:hypothetical protein
MVPNNPNENPWQDSNPEGNHNPWQDLNQQPPKKEHPFEQPLNQEPQFFQGPIHQGATAQLPLPNAVLILVFGIVGIVLSCNIIGLVLNIVGLVLASQALKKADTQPGQYTESSIKQARAGRICSIIGLCIFGLAMIFVVVAMVTGALSS